MSINMGVKSTTLLAGDLLPMIICMLRCSVAIKLQRCKISDKISLQTLEVEMKDVKKFEYTFPDINRLSDPPSRSTHLCCMERHYIIMLELEQRSIKHSVRMCSK